MYFGCYFMMTVFRLKRAVFQINAGCEQFFSFNVRPSGAKRNRRKTLFFFYLKRNILELELLNGALCGLFWMRPRSVDYKGL